MSKSSIKWTLNEDTSKKVNLLLKIRTWGRIVQVKSELFDKESELGTSPVRSIEAPLHMPVGARLIFRSIYADEDGEEHSTLIGAYDIYGNRQAANTSDRIVLDLGSYGGGNIKLDGNNVAFHPDHGSMPLYVPKGHIRFEMEVREDDTGAIGTTKIEVLEYFRVMTIERDDDQPTVYVPETEGGDW